jgi:hypothetical protein
MSDIRNELFPKGRPGYLFSEIIRSSLVFLLVLGLVAVINLLVHELGHCLTMNAVGSECEAIYVHPGIKIFPLNEIGQKYGDEWPQGAVGATVYASAAPSEWTRGLVGLMGSGSVAVLSLLVLLGLYLFRPRGGWRSLLVAQSIMFLDLLTYTILPRWFGMPHFFVAGGRDPEPLDGAIRMGISESVFITAVLVFSLLMTAGLIRFIARNR